MRLKVDKLDLGEFVRLQEYIGKDSNVCRASSTDKTVLKVSVVGVDRAYSDLFDAHQPPTQFYEGVALDVVDNLLTRPELEELMSLLYKPRE